MDATFSPEEVITVANAIYVKQGYVNKFKKSSSGQTPNSDILYNHFLKGSKTEVSESDSEKAKEIIAYLTGLGFKSVERGLTDFEVNILKFVTSESVTSNQIGMAASLPEMYDRKLSQDAWTKREAELSASSDFVGTVNTIATLDLVIENVRHINRTNSYLYCTSKNGKDIVKFFNKEYLGDVGDTVEITANIKSHEISSYHNGKQTFCNRITVLK